jgi:putative ABC transport system ATP-binding protein
MLGVVPNLRNVLNRGYRNLHLDALASSHREKSWAWMKRTEIVVSASSIGKVFDAGGVKIEALKDIEIEVKGGEFVVLNGPSGSGKTTLLNIIGGIDKPTSGKIFVFDEDLGAKNEDFLASFRCNSIGFVFQSYNLVSTLTVAENVAFPMEWARKEESHIRETVENLLSLVGMRNREEHFPFQLSGGEQQRVAFSRALANDPPLLLVDEPTGNLDTRTSARIIEILATLRERGKTVIAATHDERVSELANQKLGLEDGKLVSQNE